MCRHGKGGKAGGRHSGVRPSWAFPIPGSNTYMIPPFEASCSILPGKSTPAPTRTKDSGSATAPSSSMPFSASAWRTAWSGLSAGFSAVHLGPYDYYYWDDFWGVAGLRAAAWLLDALGEPGTAADFRREADGFLQGGQQNPAQGSKRLPPPGTAA